MRPKSWVSTPGLGDWAKRHTSTVLHQPVVFQMNSIELPPIATLQRQPAQKRQHGINQNKKQQQIACIKQQRLAGNIIGPFAF